MLRRSAPAADVVLAGTGTAAVGPADVNLKQGTGNAVYAWGSAEDENPAPATQTSRGTEPRSSAVPAGRTDAAAGAESSAPWPAYVAAAGALTLTGVPVARWPAESQAGVSDGTRRPAGPPLHADVTEPGTTQEGAVGHVESAHLMELALGHASGDEDGGALRHIATCPRCREELRLLTRVVRAARAAGPGDLPAAAPAHTWRRISEALAYEEGAPPQPRRLAADGPAGGVRPPRPAGTGTRGGFLVTALVVGVAFVAWWWARAGRRSAPGPARPFRAPGCRGS
ncbi:hypothetical protein ACVV2G_24025 [Streptomyces ziwulingensis]